MSIETAASPLGRQVWLAIAGLGVTQIIGWGSTYYLLTVLARPISEELGLSPEFVSFGMSLLIVLSALLGPAVGRAMDMNGARPVMATGSAAAGAGLLLLALSSGAVSYVAAWMVIGASASMILYPAAFTALTQIAPAQARRAITLLTLPGGLASTVFWPLTSTLMEMMSWRDICLFYAGLNLLVCLPVHVLVIPSGGARLAGATHKTSGPQGLPEAARRTAFILFATMLACNSFVVTGTLNQFVAFLTALGQSAETTVWCGMLFGVAQVTARLGDTIVGGRHDALYTGLAVNLLFPLALVLLGAVSPLAIACYVFAILIGVCNGLLTIARGALVLSLFGVSGYGEKLGKVVVAQGLVGAAAPLVFAAVLGRWGGMGALAVSLCISLGALVAMTLLFRHASRAGAQEHSPS